MRPGLLYLVVSPLTPRHLLCTTCTPPAPDFPHFQPALFSLESFPSSKIDENLRRTEIDRGVLIREISSPQGGWRCPFALATSSLSCTFASLVYYMASKVVRIWLPASCIHMYVLISRTEGVFSCFPTSNPFSIQARQ